LCNVCAQTHSYIFIYIDAQKNGAVSKVNKGYMSHPTRAQRTLSAAGTLRVSRALRAVRFSSLCGAAGPVSKMALQHEKDFCVLRSEVFC
jgi:hypothetical protein